MLKELLLSTFFTFCSGASLGQVGHDHKLAPRQEIASSYNGGYVDSQFLTWDNDHVFYNFSISESQVEDNKLNCGNLFYVDLNELTLENGQFHGSSNHRIHFSQVRLSYAYDTESLYEGYYTLDRLSFNFYLDVKYTSGQGYNVRLELSTLYGYLYPENSNSTFSALLFQYDGGRDFWFDYLVYTPGLTMTLGSPQDYLRFYNVQNLYDAFFISTTTDNVQVDIDEDYQPAFLISNFVYSNNTFTVDSTGSWSGAFQDIIGDPYRVTSIDNPNMLVKYYDFIFESNGQLFNGIRFNMTECDYILNGEGKAVDYSSANPKFKIVYNVQYHLLNVDGIDGFVTVANVNSTYMNVGTLSEVDMDTVYGPSSNLIWHNDNYRHINIIRGSNIVPYPSTTDSHLNGLTVAEILAFKGTYYASFAGEGIGDGISLIRLAVDGLMPMLSIMILPGITIGLLLFIPLIATLIVVVVRMVKK